ncbi:putative defense protein Hdd11 [Haliotis rufescens]|uniref:putative defense protein Hdd11 n=1 Tax=Haliotis rufescens TaxID=6454 RepID=UPI00201E877A|nr:putative defense protein Hdd11 [Haliotis rufescens]
MKPCIIIFGISVLVLGTRANVFDLRSCENMVPAGLTATEQTSLPPYRVSVSTTEYEDGVPVDVVLSSTDASTTFTELLLQARCLTCANLTVPVGTFTIPAGQSPSEILGCFETMAVITSSTTNPKTSVTFTWTPPAGFADVVIMRATFVQDSTRWWGNVVSQTMNAKSVPLGAGGSTPAAAIRPRPTSPGTTRPPATTCSTSASPSPAATALGPTLGLLTYCRLLF